MSDASPRAARVQSVARAMCIAMGNDPDAAVCYGPVPSLALNGVGNYYLVPAPLTTCRAWQAFTGMAEAAVTEMDGKPGNGPKEGK